MVTQTNDIIEKKKTQSLLTGSPEHREFICSWASFGRPPFFMVIYYSHFIDFINLVLVEQNNLFSSCGRQGKKEMNQNQVIVVGNPNQPQVMVAGNRVWYGNQVSAAAYRRQKLIAISILLMFLSTAIVVFVVGVSSIGGIMLGVWGFLCLFAICMIYRARKRHQEVLAQNALYGHPQIAGQNQVPLLQAPQGSSPGQYPASPPQSYPVHYSAAPYPAQTQPGQQQSPPASYPSQAASTVIQKPGGTSAPSRPSIEPPPPSYEQATAAQNQK